MGSILSSSCSRSYFPLSRQDAALAHLNFLPPHDLVLWTDGFVPFPFSKGGSLWPLFLFLQAHRVQIFLLKPAPFYMLFTAPISLPLLFFFYLAFIQSSPPSFLLPQTILQELSSLSSCSVRLQLVPRTLVSPGERCG